MGRDPERPVHTFSERQESTSARGRPNIRSVGFGHLGCEPNDWTASTYTALSVQVAGQIET